MILDVIEIVNEEGQTIYLTQIGFTLNAGIDKIQQFKEQYLKVLDGLYNKDQSAGLTLTGKTDLESDEIEKNFWNEYREMVIFEYDVNS